MKVRKTVMCAPVSVSMMPAMPLGGVLIPVIFAVASGIVGVALVVKGLALKSVRGG